MNWLDKAIGIFSPRAALKRAASRRALRAYDGAAVGRRTAGWRAPTTSADTEISASLPKLRARSRDLQRNSAHARKAKSVWTNNLVGEGIKPRCKDKRVMDLFAQWSKQCDTDGQLNFDGIIELMVSEMIEGGEALLRQRARRPEDGLVVPLQLQVYESEQLDISKIGTIDINGTTNRIINGVEVDQIGRRRAYWLFQDHPGSLLPNVPLNYASVPIPADQIIHLYRKERTQMRGVPWCSSVVRDIRDRDDYKIAEGVRKKTESCVVAIVTGADPGDDAIAPFSETTPPGMSVTDSNGRPVEHFEPGLIAYAHGSKDVKFNSPNADGGFVDWSKASLHEIAAGFLIPYELLSGDLSMVNFSSARVAIQEFRRLCGVIQYLCIVPMMLDRVWKWFCEAAYLAGLIPKADVPVEWVMPMFASVNPIDDVNADILEVRAGFVPLTVKIAERGYDPEWVFGEIDRIKGILDEMGIVLDTDPEKVSKGGQSQASQQSQEAAKTPPPPARSKPRLVKEN